VYEEQEKHLNCRLILQKKTVESRKCKNMKTSKAESFALGRGKQEEEISSHIKNNGFIGESKRKRKGRDVKFQDKSIQNLCHRLVPSRNLES
jgi:hypothetical protein